MSDAAPFAQRAAAVPGHVLVRQVADELVLLSLESEEYFGLDPVGTRMWQLLTAHPTMQAALEGLLAEYDVDATRLSNDLNRFVAELASRKLIDIVEPRSE